MQDHPLVRGLHHRAHLQEQVQPLRQRERPLAAPGLEAGAFDQLHHQVGVSVGGHAAVVQARQPRQFQVGQDLAFARQPPVFMFAGQPVQQLDRHRLPVGAVGAFGLEHYAHAADADLPDQPPRPKHLPGHRPAAGHALNQRIQRGQLRRLGHQQAQYLPDDRRVAATGFQRRPPLFAGQFAVAVEQVADGGPVFGLHRSANPAGC